MQDLSPSVPLLVDSPNGLAEAEVAESLARSLDIRYRSRGFRVGSSTQADVSGLGPRVLQRLAFEQATVHQMMVCWAAKVSIGDIHLPPESNGCRHLPVLKEC